MTDLEAGPVVAARRVRKHAWAFLVPLVAVWLCDTITEDGPTSGARLLAVCLIGVAAGTAWQLLHRRDLVDRLTVCVSVFGVWTASVFGVLWRAPISLSFDVSEVCAAGILAGCVYCEQWQRWRRRRPAHGPRAGVSSPGTGRASGT